MPTKAISNKKSMSQKIYLKIEDSQKAVLLKELEEAKCEQEELEEAGDLEEGLAAAQRVANLETLINKGTPVYWLSCGLCKGRGNYTEYGDIWPCSICSGKGGSWLEKH